MRINFESKTPSYFPVWKLTLVPGENSIADKIGKELLEAQALDCKASGEKPRITALPAKPTTEAKTKPIPVVTSATSSPKADKDKKGAK